MNGKSKAWALALLLGVFLLGGLAGAAVDRLIVGESARAESNGRRESGRARRSKYLDWLSEELALTDAQRAQVEASVDRHREQVDALWRDMRPRFQELQAELRSEIRGVLSADQQEAYEALLKKEAERHRSRDSNQGRR